jgi:putative ABC transport system permease protein
VADSISDVRLALRTLLRRPGFFLVTVLTLALGIGATSAIFTVVNAVLLKPLPFRHSEELALIWSRWSNFDKTWLSEAEYLDYERLDRLFQNVGAWGNNGQVALTGGAGPESVDAMVMTANLLEVLGVSPELGRSFLPEEDIPNGPAVVMLGFDLWRRRLGGDPAVIGQTILIDGQPARVVGILPRSFRFPLEFQNRVTAQVVQPLGPNRSAPQRGSHGLFAIGRLKPGVTPPIVTGELVALTRRWTEQGLYPETMKFTAFAVPLVEEVTGKVKTALLVLAGAVVLLLLLTCTNVANLILTRSDARRREIAVRTALGAGQRQLLRLALTEGLILSLIGGLAGLGLAWAGVRLLVARAPTTVPRLGELTVDTGVLALTLVLSVATGILFGLLPVAHVAGRDLSGGLREGARGQSGSLERMRGRALLVVSEMALAVLLVIGAGLTVRSFINLQNIDPGFDARNVLTLRLSLPAQRYQTVESVAGFYQQLADQVRALQGVRAAGLVRQLPLATEIGDAGMAIEGKPTPPGEPGRSADWQVVTPGYFEAMGERLVRGRFFDARDTPDGFPVIAINQTLAREYFGDQDPIGQRIRVGGPNDPFRTIVGIIGDVHHNGLTTPVKRKWFVPHNQWGNLFGSPRRAMTLVARTPNDPRRLLAPVSTIIRQMDPDLPITQVTTMAEVLATATQEQRFTMMLMAGFAALALILAAVGIYGVISYAVSQRTREVGIRLALGADRATVLKLLLRQGMTPAAVGIGAGLVIAMVLTRYLGALLYGVAPRDLLTFTSIPALLLVVAIGSVCIPALRASRVEPVEALRVD